MMSGNPISIVADRLAAICILLLFTSNHMCMSYKAEGVYPLPGGEVRVLHRKLLRGVGAEVGTTCLYLVFNPNQLEKRFFIHFFYLTRFQVAQF